MRHSKRHVDEMINARMPVVAAVNGPAVGLGCTIASLSDIVFMADNARLMDPHVGVALVAGDGGAVTWPHLTSLIKAKQYLLTGDPIPAEEAVAIGLANFVVGREELLPSAVAFAHRLASQPPQAVQETKSLLNQQLRLSAVAALGYGIAAETHAHDTPEYREAYERMRRGSND
jgi:enoyl-CoA hydratase/carnithine racemase